MKLLLLPFAILMFVLSSGQFFSRLARHRMLRLLAGLFAVAASVLMLKDYVPPELVSRVAEQWDKLVRRPCGPGHARDAASGACVADPSAQPATSERQGGEKSPGPKACPPGEELFLDRCTCKLGFKRATEQGPCQRVGP